MTDQSDDAAVEALATLIEQLEHTTAQLRAASERAHELIEQRSGGRSWHEIVSSEERPLIVERITRALDDLGAAGSHFRREEARALQREGLSITDISKLFGVTRQRVSTLVQTPVR